MMNYLDHVSTVDLLTCLLKNAADSLAAGNLGGAEDAYRELTLMFPDRPTSLFVLGDVLMLQGRPAEAIPYLKRAFYLAPDDPNYSIQLAHALMRSGDYISGFAILGKLQAFVQSDPTLWDGSALDGRSFRIDSHAGLGDCVQFARYATLLKERGARSVILHLNGAKYRRLSGAIDIAGVDEVRNDEIPPTADCSAPILMLPGLFKTDIPTIPAKLPYVGAVRNEIQWIRSYCRSGAFKVGLCWHSSEPVTVEIERSGVRIANDWASRSIPGRFCSP